MFKTIEEAAARFKKEVKKFVQMVEDEKKKVGEGKVDINVGNAHFKLGLFLHEEDRKEFVKLCNRIGDMQVVLGITDEEFDEILTEVKKELGL